LQESELIGAISKVLYVDNDRSAINAFCHLFKEMDGYVVHAAESADEGLKILAAEQPISVVAVTFSLDGTTGLDFISQARKDWPETVCLLLTEAADGTSVASPPKQDQADQVIVKPWNDAELKETISGGLQLWLRRLNRQLSEKLQSKSDELSTMSEQLREAVKQAEVLEIRNRVAAIAQGVLDVLPVAVFGIDAEKMIVQCNEFACELFPAGVMGPLGRSSKEIFPAQLRLLLERAGAELPAPERIQINDSVFRAEVRPLAESLAQGVVLVLIPD
jgi:two-component system NtrC family sensor kinase